MTRLAVILALLAGTASAHDWYPVACCSGKDCAPLSASDYELTAEGYRIIASGEIIPYGTERMSPDGSVHRCSWQGKPGNRTIGMNYDKPCFWVPMMGASR